MRFIYDSQFIETIRLFFHVYAKPRQCCGILQEPHAEYASIPSLVQVGLLGLARSLQKDLDRIADKADTSSPEGLHFILTGTSSSHFVYL